MQAIWRSEHIRFCEWLQEMKIRQELPDHVLDEMESMMKKLYTDYLQKGEEIRSVIMEYKKNQKAIRNKIKINRKSVARL